MSFSPLGAARVSLPLVLSALFLIGLPVAGTIFQQASMGVDRMSIATQIALQLIATTMLLTPASRDWLPGRDG